MTSEHHPATGFHYINVLGGDIIFSEVHRCHEYAASKCDWMSTMPLQQFKEELDDRSSSFYHDKNLFYIIAGQALFHDPRLEDRVARVALRFSEVIDEGLMETGRKALERLQEIAPSYDIVFLFHRPTSNFLPNSRHAIFGYEPEVMGTPDFECEKERDIVFYGSSSPRREKILQGLRENLKHELKLINGLYGPKRKAALDRSRVILDIPLRPKWFATMRLWQAIASSAVMCMPERDTWPAIPGRHYIQIPNSDDMVETALAIDEALDNSNLTEIAKRAHDELSIYTVEYCMNEFVVPATGELV